MGSKVLALKNKREDNKTINKATTIGNIRNLKIRQIILNENQPRSSEERNDEEIKILAKSIDEFGLLNPIYLKATMAMRYYFSLKKRRTFPL